MACYQLLRRQTLKLRLSLAFTLALRARTLNEVVSVTIRGTKLLVDLFHNRHVVAVPSQSPWAPCAGQAFGQLFDHLIGMT